MDMSELAAVLERYPELQAGLPDHLDELTRIAARILEFEARPVQAPELPADAPAWERDYWQRWVARSAVTYQATSIRGKEAT
jgi:hypothetical protein